MNILLLLISNHIACYESKDFIHWTRQTIKGELQIDLKTKNRVAEVLQDRIDYSQLKNKLASCQINFIYDAESVHALNEVPYFLSQQHCTQWQIVLFEPLLHKIKAGTGIVPKEPAIDDKEWLEKYLLPLVQSTFTFTHYETEVQQENIEPINEHEETIETLRQAIATKQEELNQVKNQISALHRPNLEQLITFLPVFYKNFFGSISPAELGLLAGLLEPPQIPSPYPEPSANTLLQLKKKLLKLPKNEQSKIMNFCMELEHKLDIRPEMRELFEELKNDK